MNGIEYDGWVPSHVREYLKDLGYRLPLEDMEPHILEWDECMSATGDFYNYRDTDSFGRVYQVHRRSIKPAMRVCREWGSLLLNEQTRVVCEDQTCTDWLDAYFSNTGFMGQAQANIARAFGLGTGAFALFFDIGRRKVKIRHFDARMVIPLTWDAEGVTECAFVTRAYYRGKPVDQLQMHVIGDHVTASPSESFTMENSEGGIFANDIGTSARLDEGKSYHVITASFDEDGNLMEPEGVISDYDTGCPFATFAIIKPAIPNTRVEASPYGQSVFADAIDAVQSVDLAFDALVNEVSAGKMRIFLSDVMFDYEKNGDKKTPIPFGKGDCTIFRKVMSTEDVVQEFAPALRTSSQAETFRIALQMLGDLCGFGLTYYDFDSSGYVKTATEVSSDNSALMRNIRKHENALTRSLSTISHALLWCARGFGEVLPAEGVVTVQYDDSIVTDTSAEKAQDMAEVAAGLMGVYEYRMRWYSEDEATARRRAGELSRPVVLEVTYPDKSVRHKRGKDDFIDAEMAAEAAFTGNRTVTPKTRDGMVEALRMLHKTRQTAVKSRRVALQMINDQIVSAPEELRDQLRGMTRMQLIRHLVATRPDKTAFRTPDGAARISLKHLAKRYVELDDEVSELDDEVSELDDAIAAILADLAPKLVALPCVGPQTASQLMITVGDNPGRIKSEASFAMLCGVAPIPVSTGMKSRHRLNRGGDRAANSAIHIIAVGRLRTDERTRVFIDRKMSEGHTKTEAIRCLKRYIAREVYYVIKEQNRSINSA